MDGIAVRGQKKKLIEAAECWASGGVIDNTADDLAAWGVFPDDLLDAKESKFQVWEDNAESVLLFLRVSTQWRVAGMGGFLGLDYGVIFQIFDLYDIKDRIERFEDLQVMERAALIALQAKNGND